MNREDIMRMAQEAGFVTDTTAQQYQQYQQYQPTDTTAQQYQPNCIFSTPFDKCCERFANLVAAAEREACAKLCEDEAWRLKKLAVDMGSSSTNTKAIQASNDADAIRARGNT